MQPRKGSAQLMGAPDSFMSGGSPNVVWRPRCNRFGKTEHLGRPGGTTRRCRHRFSRKTYVRGRKPPRVQEFSGARWAITLGECGGRPMFAETRRGEKVDTHKKGPKGRSPPFQVIVKRIVRRVVLPFSRQDLLSTRGGTSLWCNPISGCWCWKENYEAKV